MLTRGFPFLIDAVISRMQFLEKKSAAQESGTPQQANAESNLRAQIRMTVALHPLDKNSRMHADCSTYFSKSPRFSRSSTSRNIDTPGSMRCNWRLIAADWSATLKASEAYHRAKAPRSKVAIVRRHRDRMALLTLPRAPHMADEQHPTPRRTDREDGGHATVFETQNRHSLLIAYAG